MLQLLFTFYSLLFIMQLSSPYPKSGKTFIPMICSSIRFNSFKASAEVLSQLLTFLILITQPVTGLIKFATLLTESYYKYFCASYSSKFSSLSESTGLYFAAKSGFSTKLILEVLVVFIFGSFILAINFSFFSFWCYSICICFKILSFLFDWIYILTGESY